MHINVAILIGYRGATALELHVDHNALGLVIATFSIARSDTMTFQPRARKEPICTLALEQRSVLLLTG